MTHVILKLQLHVSPDKLAQLHQEAAGLAAQYAKPAPGQEQGKYDLTLDTTSNFTIK